MDRQGIQAIDLWLERDTPRTPEPGRWYLFHGDRVLGDWAQYKAAQAAYQRARQDLGAPSPERAPVDGRALLVAESQADYLDRSAGYWTNAARHRGQRRR